MARQVVIRPIQPDDAEDLQATFQRLSMESIYLRFLSFKKVLDDEEALYLASVDYTSRMAFVAIYKENGHDIVVGVSRYALLDKDDRQVAESAVVVADEYQGRGLGKLLLRRLVTYARAKGIHTLRGNMQIGNNRMLDLVRRSGLPHQTRYRGWDLGSEYRYQPAGAAAMTERGSASPAELACSLRCRTACAGGAQNRSPNDLICRKYAILVRQAPR